MTKTSSISPEAVGVLRALSRLGKIRHFDAVVLELAALGLAKLDGDQLAITRKGRLLGRIVRRPPPGARRATPDSRERAPAVRKMGNAKTFAVAAGPERRLRPSGTSP